MLVIERHMLNPYRNEPNINMVAVAMGLATLNIRREYILPSTPEDLSFNTFYSII